MDHWLRRCLQQSLIICVLMPLSSIAQPEQTDTSTATPAKASGPPRSIVSTKPLWSSLTPLQQHALQPLAGSWATISDAQKRKWIAVSKNYPSLSPEGQATMQGRMNEWISLTPLQRAEARLNFATTSEFSKQLTPAEKLAKWQTYQSLSVDEKQKLAEKASAKPAGAAMAVKPVASQKLAPVQPHLSSSSGQAGWVPNARAPNAGISAPTRAASAR